MEKIDLLKIVLQALSEYSYNNDFKTFYEKINLPINTFREKRLLEDKNKYILVTQMNGIGDATLTTGFIRELYKLYPQYKIIFITNLYSFPMYELCPYIYKTYDLDISFTNTFSMLEKLIHLAYYQLWDKNIEIAISPMYGDRIIHNLFMNYFSLAPERIGYGEQIKSMYFDKNYYRQTFGQGFNFDPFLLTKEINHPKTMYSDIEKKFFILKQLGNIYDKSLELWIDEEEDTYFFNLFPIKKDPILIGLGGSQENKKLSYKKWIKILNQCTKLTDKQFIFLGSKAEETYAVSILNDIKNKESILNLVNKLTLREIIALTKASSFYFGHDTGLMHIATAVNKPVLVLSAEGKDREKYKEKGFLSYYLRFQPYYTNKIKYYYLRPKEAIGNCKEIFVQNGCFSNESHCINSISTEKIIKAFKDLLRSS